jgi:hypothetical protein
MVLLWGKTMLSKVAFFKSESGAIPIPPAFNVFVSPTDYDNSVNKGSFTTPTFTASVTGGTAPFTYGWYIDTGSLSTPSLSTTKATLSGYNITVIANLTVIVTDATMATTTNSATIMLEFGS